ncbi:putative transporter [Photobacterium kishitanii]|uniref:Transporter n=1 Tax=Photobacterium kishitanii TaxID=318456 RepID=A0AAX0YU34_9GAMM|nr:putative transporter [Photobacterium kishitanii]PSU20126.1 putative transporter [Photobacterium kishitanii]PSV06522.1 putative transporter [Photobacterium kishitanii]PSV12239.1 putative transporter [Photobacterium kishitanii]PSV77405.1 putative transporter [Photobacterium kishitanii]PSX19015.1 putative transporter [Photobacterium kishitanii]
MFRCFYLNKKWVFWSVYGTTAVVLINWLRVGVDVELNYWNGEFYDLIQAALVAPNTVSINDFKNTAIDFFKLTSIYVVISVVVDYFVRHWIFRWRCAMNEHYMSHWSLIRHIEGSSQRIQEDTMRFAKLVEDLGISILRNFMTLATFIPLLWELSKKVKVIPFFGEVEHSMVIVAVISSFGGMAFLMYVGRKLPGLEYNNQRVEAAYRKELVLGEDNVDKAAPQTVKALFNDVRHNYFNMYRGYLMFDSFSSAYGKYSELTVYIFMSPTILQAAITLGVLKQITSSYSKVESSLRFLIRRWSSCVELMSIYKRLRAFESQIDAAAFGQKVTIIKL